MKENKYEVRYSELFKYEVENAIKYIIYELKNNIAAENLAQLIEKEIHKRSKCAENFKYFKLEDGQFKWYRINVKNYSIFYTVENNVMTLRRFLYGKRNIDKFL